MIDDYLGLGLRLGRHVDGLVDAYYGPPALKEQVDAEQLPEAKDLVADAERLLDGLDDGWLRYQVVGLETVARKLAGEEIPYADEVERCYGIRPRHVPEEQFEAAHRALDDLLPGEGSLAERYQAWREGDPVPSDKLPAMLEAIASDLRALATEVVGLPNGEQAELDYVTDEPWSAFNYYLGGLRSRIAVNVGVPMLASRVVHLVAHEIYPGHHTEHATKEQVLVRDRGRLEESILLVGTPSSLISEGIAEVGTEILLEDQDRFTADHLSRVGLDYDAELAATARGAREPLEHVSTNAALAFHEGRASLEETRDYLRRWGLVSDERAGHMVSFLADPLWRSYVTTYTDGYQVCRDWVGGDPARFRRLLTEQLSPADLLA